MNNSSQNNFGNDDNFNNLSQTTVTQATVMRTPVACNNNFGQQPMSNVALNNNVTISSDPNYQQYDASNNNTTYNYQQYTSNGISNNNDTTSYHQQCDASNNIPHNNYQQSTSNNGLPLQFYPQYINQNPLNPPQSNIFPLLNSLGINISSPQTTIIIMPATNSDIQNQLQQIHTYLNYSSSTNNSQTRPQQ